jgi:serine protease Do
MCPVKFFALCMLAALPWTAAVAQQQQPNPPADSASQVRPAGSYLGVSILEINAEQGVQIVRVTADTPAAKAGLKTGDILLSYNGEPVLSSQQLGRLVWETPPGRHVKVQFSREGKILTAQVVTAAPPIPTHSVNFGSNDNNWRPEFNGGLADVPIPSIAWRNMLLGMEYESLSPQLAPYFGVHEGILVRSVDNGSAAEKAGIKPGDVVVSMGDRAVAGRQDLSGCIRQQNAPGKALGVDVVRNRKHLSLTVQIAAQ